MSSLEISLGLSGQSNIRRGVDASTGHGCFPSTIPAMGSISTFTDMISEVRVTDSYVPHCCPNQGCHKPVAAMGSRSAFTDMLATHRNGDMLSCGDRAFGGSLSTFSGN